jgi:UDP-glucose 4-epimerase
VKRIVGLDFPVVLEPRRAGDPPEVVATSKKIRRLLGWEPHYGDLDTIIAHALKWEQSLLEQHSQDACDPRALRTA